MALDNVNVLGRDYSVEFVPDLGDNYGECEHEGASIEIVAGLDDHLRREIILHEVMHAILRQQGRQYSAKEEEFVTALACGLIPVLDSNPKLRKALRC